MDYQTMYAQKLRTADEAVRIVKDRPVPSPRRWTRRWRGAAGNCMT